MSSVTSLGIQELVNLDVTRLTPEAIGLELDRPSCLSEFWGHNF